ncbi:hypothetical protein BU16DRAFT_545284 [Lophium mytilinum]|uniref:Uncharacterized protein n=1 Tax=Lophium mytilinum TaxID=390894 RepID=A0A6A6QAY6_9PEZI|nr:hypothetical protein BU16DRAFT_545284 [Lophium mytilinum]
MPNRSPLHGYTTHRYLQHTGTRFSPPFLHLANLPTISRQGPLNERSNHSASVPKPMMDEASFFDEAFPDAAAIEQVVFDEAVFLIGFRCCGRNFASYLTLYHHRESDCETHRVQIPLETDAWRQDMVCRLDAERERHREGEERELQRRAEIHRERDAANLRRDEEILQRTFARKQSMADVASRRAGRIQLSEHAINLVGGIERAVQSTQGNAAKTMKRTQDERRRQLELDLQSAREHAANATQRAQDARASAPGSAPTPRTQPEDASIPFPVDSVGPGDFFLRVRPDGGAYGGTYLWDVVRRRVVAQVRVSYHGSYSFDWLPF